MTMTRAEVFKLFEETIIPEMKSLLDAGQKEYSHDQENALANFERLAAQLGVPCPHCKKTAPLTRDVVLLVYLLKHLDGIISYSKGHKSQREDVRGRVNDSKVYLCLLRSMIEDDERRESESKEPPGNTPKSSL